MKSFIKRFLSASFTFVCSCVASSAGAQIQLGPNELFYISFPYDNVNSPGDGTKDVYGENMAEVCAQRSSAEILFGPPSQATNIIYVGFLPNALVPGGGQCGYKALNPNGNVVVTVEVAGPGIRSCADIINMANNNSGAPVPQKCVMGCPPEQVGPDGKCPALSPKNGGKPKPCCGNPVNPGTGNKFQLETDLAAVLQDGLSLTRYYNTGRAAPMTKVFGGYWQHNYTRKITEVSATQAAYYSADGKVLTFNKVAGLWTAEADVADVLTEFVDSNGIRTGWTYNVASTDDIETFGGSGNLLSIRNRAGLVTTLTQSDGTDGSSSGNGGFILDAQGNPTTEVLPRGYLFRVSDAFGRTLHFGYDSRFRIVKITDPAGGVIRYGYGGRDVLTSVTYPDTRQRLYLYNEPAHTGGANMPNHLTGIVDENGTRFATFAYDQQGRATKTTHHAGGNEVDRYTLTYDVSGSQTTIVDPLGTSRTNGFQNTVGVYRRNAESQPKASGTGTASAPVGYDANGNVSSRTDFNGNRTNYSYDLARNLETSRTEGLTSTGGATPQTRTISTQWHTTFRLPTVIAEPLRRTTFAYDADGTTCGARGALCSKTIQATTDANGSQGFSAPLAGSPRTWTYTYNANGSVLTVNGPRTDVADITTYTYYPNNATCPTTNGGHATGCRGQVETISNALSQITSITDYNAHGRPLRIVDPNGLTTTMTYDQRQRLTSRTVGGQATVYEYDFAGQLTKVISPDTSFISYTYDDAHRLTQIQDNQGNKIVYTVDNMGNRTLEEVRDPTSALAQKQSRVFNNLNRLFQVLGAENQTTEYTYDDQGNVLTVKDPLNHVTTNQYDELNRLKQVTSPAPVSAATQYTYNGLDALIQVTDPRSLITTYTIDGLGNLMLQQSPDTGNSVNCASQPDCYDTAGNLVRSIDAKGQQTTYAYDALNRTTLITFHDGAKQTYAYDAGANSIGRLSSITETNPANQVTSVIAYGYDQHGRVTSETRTVAGIQYVLGYRYDNFGRLDQVDYPSGRTVTYDFDALGRVAGVTTQKPGASAQTVISNVIYHPFGVVKGYTLGNGQLYTRGIDLDGRIASYTLGTQSPQNPSFSIGYDAASRINCISPICNPPNGNTYAYDNLDRLISASLPGGAVYGYEYDSVGNRILSTGAQYTYSNTSNRIASITPSSGPVRNFVFDPNGSTTADGINTYVYDVRGRMSQSTSAIGVTNYQLNALGQRIRKTNSLGDTIFHYDTQGRRLIGETDPAGNLKREFIYLGDIPVGVVQ